VTTFGLSIKQFRTNFFDFEKIVTKAEAANRRGLARFGGLVRTKARRSIRKRKKTSSAPSAPHSHTGLLRDHIYFAQEQAAGVIIGPAALKTSDGPSIITTQGAPETLEEGGRVGVREVFYHGAWHRRGTVRGNGTRQRVRWVTIKKRQYMGPAFNSTLPMTASFWRDSIKG
jgi:hypothetical protein